MAVTGNLFIFIENSKTENSWFPACQLKHKNFYKNTLVKALFS